MGVSEQDVQDWLKVQGQVHVGEPIPEVSATSTPKTGGGGLFGSIIDLLKQVIGTPQDVTVAGKKIRVKAPKVKVVKKYLAKYQSFTESEDPEKNLAILQDIMFICLEFESDPPEDLNEWFDDLDIDEAANLVDTFRKVFDVELLIQKARILAGKR
jgi:hypothetical protein